MPQRVSNVVAWVLSVLLGLSFVFAGWPKIEPGPGMIRRFENWGYSAEFAVVIGIAELLAGIAILVRPVSFYAALAIVVLMIGAIYTHVSSGIGSSLFAVVYLLMAVGVMLSFTWSLDR